MAYYLQMDGIDDFLRAPQLTVDKVVMDFVYESNPSSTLAWYLYDNRAGTPAGNYNMYVNNTGVTITKGSNVTSFSLNGGAQQTTSQTVSANTRYLLEINHPAVTSATDGIEFFVSYALQATSYTKGRLYDIKFYNGGVLVAHYDMTLGNVQDQSGNGKHGILTGGTWVSDAPAGTDVSYAYATKQSIYADRTAQASMKQSVYADRSYANPTKQAFYADRQAAFPTKQTVYADRSFSYATKQAIYALRSWEYPTLQQIVGDYVLFNAVFSMLQKIYADRSLSYQTKQRIYADNSYSFLTKQRIYEIVLTELQTIWSAKQPIDTVWISTASHSTEWTTKLNAIEERKYAPE